MAQRQNVNSQPVGSSTSRSTSEEDTPEHLSRYSDIIDNIITRFPMAREGGEVESEDDRVNNEKDPLLLKHDTEAESSSHHSVFIYLVTVLSAIGGFLFGYDTGIVSGAMVFIRDYFQLSNLWQELIVSATILAAWIFSLSAGALTNAFGRKWVIVLASGVFTVGGFMMALAQSKEVLLVGRFTVGIAIGLASMVIPVYIAEVAPVQLRGKLVTINVCFITFGQFIASILAGVFSSDPVHGWRWMLGIASVPSTLQLLFFIFLPESPRWLISKGHYDEAYLSLMKFRANTSPGLINAEYESIRSSCLASQQEEQSSSLGRILRTPAVRRALLVGCLLMTFQQLAGINTVMYYSATIIQMSGVHDKSTAVWLSAATASVNFLLSFLGLALVERLGRRPLILTSLFGVILALLLLGVGFQLAENNSPAIAFHTANQSVCSAVNSCNDCLKAKMCGFCFDEKGGGQSILLDGLQRSMRVGSGPQLNGTCLLVDPGDPLHSAESGSLCSNGTSAGMVWANNWCPSSYSWMTLAGLMLYLFFFAPGMGPDAGESICCSISTSFNWAFNLLVSLTFLSLGQVLTNHGVYYLYAGIALVGWLTFYVFLPETKGKSLEEIEVLFDRPLCELGRSRKDVLLHPRVRRSSRSPSTDDENNTA
ncbi:hypothetical protein TYRP_001386 [Tyrophagus putrescentiae]|nr:hypothetical protein TYRP_001386 [Tyrophagus putrescentiae]